MRQSPEKLARHFMEAVVSTMDGEAIGSYFAEEGTFQAQGKFSNYAEIKGPPAIKEYFDALAKKVYTKGPARIKVFYTTAEGNRVVTEWQLNAETSGGPYENRGATVIEFDASGKIRHIRQYLDTERVVNLLKIIEGQGQAS